MSQFLEGFRAGLSWISDEFITLGLLMFAFLYFTIISAIIRKRHNIDKK